MDELAQQLEDLIGYTVSRWTVWRALRKLGFTRKKVSLLSYHHLLFDIFQDQQVSARTE